LRSPFLFKGEEDLLIGGAPQGLTAGHRLWRRRNVSRARTPLRLLPSRIPSRISRMATFRRAHGARRRDSAMRRAARSNAQFCAPRHRPSWWTRAITGISWPRRSMSSRKWFGHTLAHYPRHGGRARCKLPNELPFDFRELQRISISACGTSYYAGLVAKYWFERFRAPAGRDRLWASRVSLPRSAP